MRTESMLDTLSCPRCRKGLKISNRAFTCRACGSTFPVKRKIPRFLLDMESERKETKRSFDYQWLRSPEDYEASQFNPQYREILSGIFSEDVRIPPEWFRGKLCLDMGCGSGRWTYALASMGADVISADLTDSGVEATRKSMQTNSNITVIQADIFNLPFRERAFDFIVSWGVLHHTHNTRKAFQKLVPHLKDNGTIFIMVYEKHNPVQMFITELARKALSRLSKQKLYRFCRYPAILARYKIIRTLAKPFITIGESQHDLYDCYSTPINHHHREKEVLSWFEKNNLKEVEITNKERYSDPVRRFLRGPNGGTLRVKGKRSPKN
jgi:2-polyprenyl-3-methyl-5-hydroxy-6-metoxy-1,4-benzoquinol methylase